MSGGPPLLALAEVRLIGRGSTEPFRLRLGCNSGSEEILCLEVVRIIPGKRLVCFAEWNGVPVVAKLFIQPSSAKRHCKRELRGTRGFQQAEIATPELLFEGWLGNKNCPVLLQERICPGEDLNSAWDNCKTEAEQTDLLNRAVRLVAKHHSAGLKQADLHLGNFILQENELFSIDGSTVQINRSGRPLSVREGLKNLALLLAQLPPQNDVLVIQIYEMYLKARNLPVNRNYLASFQRSIRSQFKKRTRTVLGKTTRNCTEFIAMNRGPLKIVCNRKFDSAELRKVLEDPEQAIEAGTLLEKNSALIRANGQAFVISRFENAAVGSRLLSVIQPSAGLRAWHSGHLKKLQSIPAARPVAFVEEGCGPFVTVSYVVYEYLPKTLAAA